MKINKKNKVHLNVTLPRLLLLIVINSLHLLSGFCVLVGGWIALMVLITGGATIENSRFIALGILLFLPIRYMKKYLEEKM